MRLYLINPSNPLVNIINVKESYWNRYRVWKPLSLLVLAGLTPAEWEISIVDENLGAPDYPAMPRAHLVSIHATMCMEEVMEHVDSVVMGEAEGIWSRDVILAACSGVTGFHNLQTQGRRHVFRQRESSTRDTSETDLADRRHNSSRTTTPLCIW